MREWLQTQPKSLSKYRKKTAHSRCFMIINHLSSVINNLHSSSDVNKFCLHSGGGWDSQGWSSSMTSSMQLAQECLKDPPEASEEPPAPLEGLEMFAQTIETGELKLRQSSLYTGDSGSRWPSQLYVVIMFTLRVIVRIFLKWKTSLNFFPVSVCSPSSY